MAHPGVPGGGLDFVVDRRAGAARGLEPQSDFDALHGRDREHGLPQPSIKAPVPRHVRAESDGKAGDDDLANTPQRVAVLLGRVDARDHLGLGRGVKRPQRRRVGGGIDVGRHHGGTDRIDPAKMHQMRTDSDTQFAQQHATDGTGGHARGRLTGRGALENVAGVGAIVLEQPGEIGMSRPHPRDLPLPGAVGIAVSRSRVHDLEPVLPVAVADQHRDRRAERLAGAHARQELDAIRFDLHAAPSAVPLLSAGEVSVDVGGQQGDTGR